MTTEQVTAQIHLKKSFLCIGLDTDKDMIPPHLLGEEDPIFAFNKAIIDATNHLCVAYKPNTAFYEAYGLEGWRSLERTIAYLNTHYPEQFTIADAKRGDIGNTATRYAKAFFEDMAFDSVTVAPYMGKDSVEPFLEFKGKHTILLALTSNDGASDFQMLQTGGSPLYEKVIERSKTYKNAENLMYVVGANKARYLGEIRKLVPYSFLLVPGVGAQGGSLEVVSRYGINENVGLLVNSSRGIIYASHAEDFSRAAAEQAKTLQQQMELELDRKFG